MYMRCGSAQYLLDTTYIKTPKEIYHPPAHISICLPCHGHPLFWRFGDVRVVLVR